jgi:hypothetical protein
MKKRKGEKTMQEQFNEQGENENLQNESDYAYKNVIKKDKKNRRTWSLVSIVFALASVFTLYFPWLSLIFGAVAVGSGVISRHNLGYFDKITLSGIIVGIFGIVFSFFGLIFAQILPRIF